MSGNENWSVHMPPVMDLVQKGLLKTYHNVGVAESFPKMSCYALPQRKFVLFQRSEVDFRGETRRHKLMVTLSFVQNIAALAMLRSVVAMTGSCAATWLVKFVLEMEDDE